MFSVLGILIYIPTKSTKRSWFLLIFTSTCYLMFFGNSHPKRCEVICHWGFDLPFPDNLWYWTPFHGLFGHLYVFLGEINVGFGDLCTPFSVTVCLSACKFSNTTYLQSFEKGSVLLASCHSSQGAQVSYSVARSLAVLRYMGAIGDHI